MLRSLLILPVLLFLSACGEKNETTSIHQENNRGIVELAKITSLQGEVLSEEWGIASKSKLDNPAFDFAFFTRKVSAEEFDKIMKKLENFYKKTPFQVWIDSTNNHLFSTFEKRGYLHKSTFPGLYMKLNRDFATYAPTDVDIQHVKTEQSIGDWALVTSAVHKLPYEELVSFCKTTLQKAPHVRFYVAYFQGKPVSSRMMIIFNRTSTGYFSSTLPEYRSKGVASHLLSYSLNELKKEGINLFTVQALAGPVVWKKFGMKEQGSSYFSFSSPPKKS